MSWVNYGDWTGYRRTTVSIGLLSWGDAYSTTIQNPCLVGEETFNEKNKKHHGENC